ncbi:MAG: hypothetical protein IPK53_01420 [bacterium]|nr:hypothetical protein [bacterium]MBK8127625.1 hypothetical protein [bacterium]
MAELSHYRARGARACVLMHEQFMQDFLDIWWAAKSADIKLPKTDDPDYLSLDHLLVHVLRAGRGYMTWICEKLELPDPAINPVPAVEKIEEEGDEFLDHLLEQWREPLANIRDDQLDLVFASRWGVDMAIESMLEHAVVHPLRHSFQLEELLSEQAPEYLE